jgi:midasin (ATPase involved in ribosome maturation)
MNFIRKTEVEAQASRFHDVPWDVYTYPFIVFNDFGTVTSIYTSVEKISQPLREFQNDVVKKPFIEYEDMEQSEIVERLLEICVDEARKNKLRSQVDLYNIVFTLDNFMKIVLIHLRLRAHMPVILMGETGVGKTSLVEYLAKIIDAECLTMNVHAGVSEEEIVTHVLNA